MAREPLQEVGVDADGQLAAAVVALDVQGDPGEVVTDAAPIYPAMLEELVPAAWHHVGRYANNPIEPITVSSSGG